MTAAAALLVVTFSAGCSGDPAAELARSPAVSPVDGSNGATTPDGSSEPDGSTSIEPDGSTSSGDDGSTAGDDVSTGSQGPLPRHLRKEINAYGDAFGDYLALYGSLSTAPPEDMGPLARKTFDGLDRVTQAYGSWKREATAAVAEGIVFGVSPVTLEGFARRFDLWLRNQERQRKWAEECRVLAGASSPNEGVCWFSGDSLEAIHAGQRLSLLITAYQANHPELTTILPDLT